MALIARDETGLQETRQACERFGIKTLAISADVVDAGALQRAAAEVETTLGAIDVWINNAMTTVLAPFRQMSEEEFRRVTEVTYLGYVNGTRAALEVMIPGIGGDYSGRLGAGGVQSPQSAYCGAKAAIRGFTDAVRTELMHEKSHIQLTMVQLPGMNTAQFGWARNKMDQAMQPVPRSISRKSPPRLFTASSSARSTSCGSEKAPSSRSSAGLLPSPARSADGEKAWEGQFTGQPKSSDQQDDLFTPVRGNHPGHGPFNDAHGVKQSPSAPIPGKVAAGVGGSGGDDGAAGVVPSFRKTALTQAAAEPTVTIPGECQPRIFPAVQPILIELIFQNWAPVALGQRREQDLYRLLAAVGQHQYLPRFAAIEQAQHRVGL